jgi:hypothetical protein
MWRRDMKYCIDDKIITELARLLKFSLDNPYLSQIDYNQHLEESKVLLERVKKKQYDLTSERSLL